MGAKTEDKTIDGLLVTTTQLPPMLALVLSKKLLPIMAPLITAGGGDGVDIGKLDLSSFTGALGSVSDAEFQRLVTQVLSNTSCRFDNENVHLGNEDAINRVFAGRFGALLQTLWFAIGVNFFPTGGGALSASSPAKANRSI
jgi:hypothetical protein